MKLHASAGRTETADSAIKTVKYGELDPREEIRASTWTSNLPVHGAAAGKNQSISACLRPPRSRGRPRRGSGQREVKGAASSRRSPVGTWTQTCAPRRHSLNVEEGGGYQDCVVVAPVDDSGLPSPLITEIIMLMLTAPLALTGFRVSAFLT